MKLRYADHSELELAPDGAKMTLHRDCVCINALILFRKTAPLDTLIPHGGAPVMMMITSLND